MFVIVQILSNINVKHFTFGLLLFKMWCRWSWYSTIVTLRCIHSPWSSLWCSTVRGRWSTWLCWSSIVWGILYILWWGVVWVALLVGWWNLSLVLIGCVTLCCTSCGDSSCRDSSLHYHSSAITLSWTITSVVTAKWEQTHENERAYEYSDNGTIIGGGTIVRTNSIATCFPRSTIAVVRAGISHAVCAIQALATTTTVIIITVDLRWAVHVTARTWYERENHQ